MIVRIIKKWFRLRPLLPEDLPMDAEYETVT